MFSDYVDHKINRVFKPDGTKDTIDSVCKEKNKTIWLQILSNERSKLDQGNDNGVYCNDVIEIVSQKEVPPDRTVVYATFLDRSPLKTDAWRVRITVDGNRLPYDGDTGLSEANIIEQIFSE